MPALVWRYLTALLYDWTSASCVALAEGLHTVSHDRLTRMLQADWSGHTLLERSLRTLFIWERGYLILDDTVLPKPFAAAIEGLVGYIPGRSGSRCTASPSCCWSGRMELSASPWGVQLWRKGGPAKFALALELLSYARNRQRCHPEYVLFDAW